VQEQINESIGALPEVVTYLFDDFPDDGELVEFRLIYRGALQSHNMRNPRASEKHLIRKEFHQQLKAFWLVDFNLKRIHHSVVFAQQSPTGKEMSRIDFLAHNFSRCGFRFLPLVTEGINVGCELDILFLRREKPGMVIHRGDIDNRMKLLFDALRMPQECNEVANQVPSADEDPFYVLLQDDSLLTKVSITTDRLLTPQLDPLIDDVEVIVSVKTRVLSVRSGLNIAVSNLEYL
jgi:hypothetical protein